MHSSCHCVSFRNAGWRLQFASLVGNSLQSLKASETHFRRNTTHNLVHDQLLLIQTDLRVHRQGKYLGGYSFCYREVAPPVTERTVCLLEMQWDRVMDAGPNALLGQVLFESVPIL